jgi:glycosyltransferase involved in cell wall biosynthesis
MVEPPKRARALVATATAISIIGIQLWTFYRRYDTYKTYYDRGLLSAIQQLLALLSLLDVTIQLLAWAEYDPYPTVDEDASLPTVSVVVPAYNESAFVRNSIRSVLESDYPADKIQLIVVDDGSTDDTWEHIVEATAEAREACSDASDLLLLGSGGPEVIIHQLETNQGKRRATHAGFTMATGEILVSVDSDSMLERGSLRALVSPFLHDPSIGGVGARLAALNTQTSSPSSPPSSTSGIRAFSKTLVPRMLDVIFDTMVLLPRTAQSAAGFVIILPGAGSAYRMEAVRPHMAELCETRFLGDPVRHGEDVELPMLILRDGWRTVYQGSSVVHTMVPETPWRALLMFTRWEKSIYLCIALGYWRLGFIEVGRWFKDRLRCLGARRQATAGDGTDEEKIPVLDLGRPETPRPGSLYAFLAAFMPCVRPLLIFFMAAGLVRFQGTWWEYVLTRVNPANFQWLPLPGIFVLGLVYQKTARGRIMDAEKAEDDEDDQLVARESAPPSLLPMEDRWLMKLVCWGPAFLFNVLFLSWSSVFGLLTLKSQSWMTR